VPDVSDGSVPGTVLKADASRGVLVATGDGALWTTQTEDETGATQPEKIAAGMVFHQAVE